MNIFLLVFKKLSFILVLGCLASCKANDQVEITGRLDQRLSGKFINKNKSGLDVLIDSQGGEVGSAYEIALSIIKYQNRVVIHGECLSACAEYLLPAAKDSVFSNNPMIGFHHNPIMDRDQAERKNAITEYCIDQPINNQLSILQQSGLSTEFWKYTEERLVLENYEVVWKENSCPWKIRKFKNHMWLPTSKQLKELWGLRFTGNVCADDFQTCSKRVDLRWETGTRIVIGDEVYTSKGR